MRTPTARHGSATSASGRLIVICGLPGSGKTTLARQLAGDLGGVRLCPDEWMTALQIDHWDEVARARIEALQWTLAQDLLAVGGTVIIEWGSWARVERDVLREGARALGAAVELHYLDLSIEELWARVRARNESRDPTVAIIQREHLEEWSTIIQPPTVEELALYDSPLR